MRLFKLPVEPQVVFDLNKKGESAAEYLEPSWQKPKEAMHRFWREHGLRAPDLPFFLAVTDSYSSLIAVAEDHDQTTENESHDGDEQDKGQTADVDNESDSDTPLDWPSSPYLPWGQQTRSDCR